MKKFTPHLILLCCLAAGVAYFVYQYSPSTLEKKESDFAVHHIDKVSHIRLQDEKGNKVDLTRKGKKWMVNGQYDINEESQALLFAALQKVETMYQAPLSAEPVIMGDISKQRIKCEIYENNDEQPAKVYYVGGPTADGSGTYMIKEIDGRMARHPYITHIPGVNAYLTTRFFPLLDRWRTVWVLRDNDQSIASLKLEYLREKQKSFEIKTAAKDSFLIYDSEGRAGDQPKQRYIHQYLEFYASLPVEQFENKALPRDTILPMQPYCHLNLKRKDNSSSDIIVYYMPIHDQSRVQFDEEGRRLLFDPEHYFILFNDQKDFAMIQYYTWGKVFRSYQDFFVKPVSLPDPK